ncbi:MAG TPA: coiled-coil domain-containing protein [Gemmatimonadales bacterium]
MPMSGKLSLGLSEKLGDQVASDLINEFNAMETARQSEFHALRLDIAGLRSDLREDLSGLRSELKQDMAGLRSDVKEDLAALRSEFKQDVAGLRSEFKQDMARLEIKIAGVQSEQIRWSFVFWLGTVGVVLLLFRFVGNPG